jgi:hypothetical protein
VANCSTKVTVFSYVIILGAKGSTEFEEIEALCDTSHFTQRGRSFFTCNQILLNKTSAEEIHYSFPPLEYQAGKLTETCLPYVPGSTLSNLPEFLLIFFSYSI